MSNPTDPKNDGGVSLPGGVSLNDPVAPSRKNPQLAGPLSGGVADGGVKEEPKPIPIVLTFDDGPHAAGKETKNYTIEVATLLKSRRIIGAFFIQTHVDFRFKNAAGKDATKAVSAMGHVIAIHTGSDESHILHTERVAAPAYDVDGDQKPDGVNALESDLIRAKSEIQKTLGGSAPAYVRAVGLERNKEVNSTYGRVGLKHIGVNVDSKDNEPPRPAAPQVVQTLDSGKQSVKAAIKAGAPHLIVLFHDINGTTAASLGVYIDTIEKEVRAAGRKPEFTDSAKAVNAIFQATGI